MSIRFVHKLSSFLGIDNERSEKLIGNVSLSLLTKGITIVVSLLLVPMTINYVNPTQYGIWLTLSSIVGWIAFFDLGLGNGFRNRFAEAKAEGDELLACQYVSTTYFAVGAVVIVVFCVAMILNGLLDWTSVLKVDASYREELQKVFGVVCAFFCCNMIVSIFSTLLTADQRPGLSSVISGLGQLCSLGSVFVLTRTTDGSLLNLALYYSGVPCLVTLICSIVAFSCTRYRKYAPSIKNIKPRLIKDILSLGVRFFAIYVCLILIFQVLNIVLSREVGADAVTQYNIAYKYFSILYSVLVIVLTPFWSAFTDAYHKKDTLWMSSALHKLEIIWIVSVIAGVAMLIISPWFYDVWIKESVNVPFLLSMLVFGMIALKNLSNVYMYLVNGIGAIRIQLVIYLLFALVSWPFLTFTCRHFGLYGIVIFPSVVYLVQSVICRIQVRKLIAGNAQGWWGK